MSVREAAVASQTSTDVWKSLADVATGATVVLAMPRAERQLCRRLAQLGLRPGMKVTVSHRTAGGGRVIKSGASRYAIDRATLNLMGVA